MSIPESTIPSIRVILDGDASRVFNYQHLYSMHPPTTLIVTARKYGGWSYELGENIGETTTNRKRAHQEYNAAKSMMVLVRRVKSGREVHPSTDADSDDVPYVKSHRHETSSPVASNVVVDVETVPQPPEVQVESEPVPQPEVHVIPEPVPQPEVHADPEPVPQPEVHADPEPVPQPEEDHELVHGIIQADLEDIKQMFTAIKCIVSWFIRPKAKTTDETHQEPVTNQVDTHQVPVPLVQTSEIQLDTSLLQDHAVPIPIIRRLHLTTPPCLLDVL